MSVDPSDPETFQEDDDAAELSVETPEADAAEQRADLRRDHGNPVTHVDPTTANEADALEQAQIVASDEDDDR